MIALKCDNPLRIRNKYNGDWLFVPCRKCESCLINKCNGGAYHLSQELKKYPFKLFVTLTYDNDNLPYACVGDSRIFRGIPNKVFPSVLPASPLDSKGFKTYLPSGFPDGQITGVLYYKDLQDFFKRLRINYYRNYGTRIKFFYSAVGEYGSFGKRPHYHVLFFGREEFTESFRDTVIDSWQMCDWSRLPMEKAIQYAEDGVSNYLAAYINSLSCCDEFLCQKSIAPRCQRSKEIGFGFDKTLFDGFQESVKRGFSCEDFGRISNSFQLWKRESNGNLSSFLLPKKIISSYFHTPANVCVNSPYELCGVYSSRISKYFSDRQAGGKIDNDSYLCWLSFNKYCNVRNIDKDSVSLFDFSLDSYLVNNYYKSLQLKMAFDAVDYDLKRYKSFAYNTKVDDLDKRSLWMMANNVRFSDDVNNPNSFNELQTYKDKFKSRLLPKHLKSLICNL